MPVASGMVRRGFLNSPAMCVPTSQPAKAQTKRLIAVPTPRPAVRQEGREVRRLDGGEGDRDDADDDCEQQAGERELHPAGHAHARTSWRGTAARRSRAPTIGTAARSTPSTATTYSPPRIATTGAPTRDAEEEPVAGHARGGAAEGAPHVARDAARVGVARGERREGARERDGQHEHGSDSEDRGGAGGRGSEAGQHEDAGAEHARDVERGALARGRAGHGAARRRRP